MHSRATAAPVQSVPFFVMGCEGSGTNLMSLILESHSRLAVCRGIHYYLHLGPNERFYGDLSKPANLRRLVRDFDEVLDAHGLASPGPERILAAVSEPTFEGVLLGFLRLYAESKGKVRAGERSAQHYLHLGRILEKFPDSPVIFTLRDPRDLALAHREGFGFPAAAAIRSWNAAYAAVRDATRPVHLVRYEDLVTDPDGTLKQACEYLGEEFEPPMLQFYQRTPAAAYPAKHHRRLFEPLSPSGIGDYSRLAKSDIAAIEQECSEGMRALGYVRSTPDLSGGFRYASERAGPTAFLLHRLRYYGLNRERWARGACHWRIAARARARYALKLAFWRSTL